MNAILQKDVNYLKGGRNVKLVDTPEDDREDDDEGSNVIVGDNGHYYRDEDTDELEQSVGQGRRELKVHVE